MVGCGKVGTAIASQLNAEGHDIVVVDIDRNAVQNLSNSLDVMGIAVSYTHLIDRQKLQPRTL